jgi:hypothetical protein
MRSKTLWALIGLNVLLLIVFVSRVSSPNQAMAQPARISDYVLIPGEVPGGTNSVVYVIDTANGLLSAMVVDESRQELSVMDPIDLRRVYATGGR